MAEKKEEFVENSGTKEGTAEVGTKTAVEKRKAEVDEQIAGGEEEDELMEQVRYNNIVKWATQTLII